MVIVSGDIGATNTRLALVDSASTTINVLFEQHYRNSQFSGLTEILRLFLSKEKAKPSAACLGVAGPVKDHRHCKTTNLPWNIDAGELEVLLNIPHVSLINDLEAIAWGIPLLTSEQIHTLQSGQSAATGNQLVIAAGTGLGQAGLYWDGTTHHPFPSEGGHGDFAPSNDLEYALLKHLQQRYSHVSWERVVSGLGIANIYDFMLEHHNQTTPTWLQHHFANRDKSAAISNAATEGTDPLCEQTLQLFTKLYAAEAGNHALKMMATGGVYLAGGIPPKILPWLQNNQFTETFNAKGRMSDLMRSMPVKVIMDDRCGLLGPAFYLAKHLR